MTFEKGNKADTRTDSRLNYEREREMKRKIFVILAVLVALAGLTGCVSEKNRKIIIRKLTEHEIIENDWEYIGYEAKDSSPIPDIGRYNYYYMDDEGIVHEVGIQNLVQKNEEHGSYYPIFVSDYMEGHEEEVRYLDPDYEEMQTKMVTKYDVTEQTTVDHYRVAKHEILFLDFWTVDEDERDIPD